MECETHPFYRQCHFRIVSGPTVYRGIRATSSAYCRHEYVRRHTFWCQRPCYFIQHTNQALWLERWKWNIAFIYFDFTRNWTRQVSTEGENSTDWANNAISPLIPPPIDFFTFNNRSFYRFYKRGNIVFVALN